MTRKTYTATAVYHRVVCGVDGSVGALEAVRQAARIADPSASSRLVTVISPWVAEFGQQLARAREIERAAQEILRSAQALLPSRTQTDLVTTDGVAWEALLAEVDADRECLLALGPPSQARLAGVVFGDAVAHLVHKAPCSVLVARGPTPEAFPRAIVVGVDGSAESEIAYGVACELQSRYGSELRPVTALGGRGVDLEAVQRILRGTAFKPDDSRPLDALRSASADADLTVVGSRGLHSARAIGSVSERVAHEGTSSVLVVRGLSAPG